MEITATLTTKTFVTRKTKIPNPLPQKQATLETIILMIVDQIQNPKPHWNSAKVSWMLKYSTTYLPHHMNSIFVQARVTFKASYGNITREISVKTKLTPLSTNNFTINTHACVASVQVSSGSKDE